MKHRRDGKRRKSKIQSPDLESPMTLEMCVMEGFQSGYCYCWKLKIWHYGRSGIPIVIDMLALDNCQCLVEDPHMDIESYIRENFGAGEFKVVIYDENDVERGKYSCNVGGADEYVHPSQELADFKEIAKLASAIMDLYR